MIRAVVCSLRRHLFSMAVWLAEIPVAAIAALTAASAADAHVV